MVENSPALTDVEQTALEYIAAGIVNTRQERSERVQACMEALIEADDITRLVAHSVMEYYVETAQPDMWLRAPWRVNIFTYTPGLYMVHDGGVHNKLLNTGEFSATQDMQENAVALGFKEERGIKAAGFLFQWLAQQSPDSLAFTRAREFGLKSGGMSRNFNTWALLFHESLLEKYVDSTQAQKAKPRYEIDPILYLTATGDWDRAAELMTPYQRKRIS